MLTIIDEDGKELTTWEEISRYHATFENWWKAKKLPEEMKEVAQEAWDAGEYANTRNTQNAEENYRRIESVKKYGY